MSTNAEKPPVVSYCNHFFLDCLFGCVWSRVRRPGSRAHGLWSRGPRPAAPRMWALDSLIRDRAHVSRTGRCILDHQQSPHPPLLPPDIFGLLPHPPYARNASISRLLNKLLPPWKCCSLRYSNNSRSHFLQIFPQISLSLWGLASSLYLKLHFLFVHSFSLTLFLYIIIY